MNADNLDDSDDSLSDYIHESITADSIANNNEKASLTIEKQLNKRDIIKKYKEKNQQHDHLKYEKLLITASKTQGEIEYLNFTINQLNKEYNNELNILNDLKEEIHIINLQLSTDTLKKGISIHLQNDLNELKQDVIHQKDKIYQMKLELDALYQKKQQIEDLYAKKKDHIQHISSKYKELQYEKQVIEEYRQNQLEKKFNTLEQKKMLLNQQQEIINKKQKQIKMESNQKYQQFIKNHDLNIKKKLKKAKNEYKTYQLAQENLKQQQIQRLLKLKHQTQQQVEQLKKKIFKKI